MEENYPGSSENEWILPDVIVDEKFMTAKIIEKTREVNPKYEAAYIKFMQWRLQKNIKDFSESIFLTYFNELATNRKPTSLWATYSMLRSMIEIKHKLNIHGYSSLLAFLKEKSIGYKSKMAQVLSARQINQFLEEAPDEKFLAVKVALIFGVQGACRRQELCDLTLNDIEDSGRQLLVKIPQTKNEKSRSFVVTGDFYQIYKKYANSRPANVPTSRFFLNYRNGKCLPQVIGINTLGGIPKAIATYLKLKDADSYTGHTFRRTSTSLLADSGADLLSLCKFGRCKSSTFSENY
ncbi:uncharacterized protein LOC123293006 [Chrysoperla carnea]|uniref:uncharacterized protein LOC123293006 n=1 Tax=Chrysoperla carnea TaxID=189513 RepID=UPI001D06EA10|nr:uncharacterized protein LOC123293006 [Chrysoperla carnea]